MRMFEPDSRLTMPANAYKGDKVSHLSREHMGRIGRYYAALNKHVRSHSTNRYNPNAPDYYEVHGNRPLPPLAFLSLPTEEK